MPVDASRPPSQDQNSQAASTILCQWCVWEPRGERRLSDSEDVSFDEYSVGASNRPRAEGRSVRIRGGMLTWTGG